MTQQMLDTISEAEEVIKKGEEVNGTLCKVYLIDNLQVDSATHEISGTVVGGQTGAEIVRNRETKEIAHKDLEYAKQSAGKLTWELSMDGCYIFGDEGYDKIEEAMESKAGTIGVFVEIGTRKYVGKILLTTQSLSLPYEEEATYSISGTGTGKLKRVEKDQEIRLKTSSKK